MEKPFSIRINKRQNINGTLLASMTQKEALDHFKKNNKFTDDQIKDAHSKAKEKAKELKGEGAEGNTE